MEKTLSVSDVATCYIKLASRLSGTVSFLQVLGSLYILCIRAQRIEKVHVSSRCRRQKSYINDNITKTVSRAKKRHSIRETTATEEHFIGEHRH